MPSITYRRLLNGEPQWGNGQRDFVQDVDAVAQAIVTRLKLFQGEWWADLSDGLPLWQKILGVGGAGKNVANMELIFQQRILGTPFVASVQDVQINFDPNTRRFNYYAKVITQFGVVVLTNAPSAPSRGLPT